jgi:hypothetical protein
MEKKIHEALQTAFLSPKKPTKVLHNDISQGKANQME